jgi:VIT1/CCC1 family predicted Fe2+/Mn2+ transporter
VRGQLTRLPDPPQRPWLSLQDMRGALGVFLLVFLATVPVVVPFLFIQETRAALRVSNGVALVMLFLCGYQLGRYAELRPARTGFVMLAVGTVLVLITIALGG